MSATSSEGVRARIIALVVLATSMAGVATVLLYPRPDAAGQYTYALIEPARDFWWAFYVLAGANLILANVASALAGWWLIRARGAALATLGGAMMCLGAVLYGVGIGGWATIGYYATNPAAVDAVSGAKLLEFAVNDFSHMYAAVLPGALLVLIGTVLLAVALWRARTVPRWVPILLASLVATFFLPTRGPVGLIAELPHLLASAAIAWILWRRAYAPSVGAGS